MSPYGNISFDTLVFHADFNSLMEDGSLAVSRRFASSPRTPTDGERIMLADHEGNRCWAKVVGSTDNAVRTMVELETWSPTAHVERLDKTVDATGYMVEVTPSQKFKLEPAVA